MPNPWRPKRLHATLHRICGFKIRKLRYNPPRFEWSFGLKCTDCRLFSVYNKISELQPCLVQLVLATRWLPWLSRVNSHPPTKWRRCQRSWWRVAACVTPPTWRLLRRKITPCYRTHHTEASPGPPEEIYGRDFNEGLQCVVPNGIGRDHHGSCSCEVVIGHQTLFTHVKHAMRPKR